MSQDKEMRKALLRKYADIKREIKKLEEKSREVQPQIIAMMQEEAADQIDTDFGSFVISRRKTWQFPDDIIEREEELKQEKLDAQRTGEATFIEKPVLIYSEEGFEQSVKEE